MSSNPYDYPCPSCGVPKEALCIDRRRRNDGSRPELRRPHPRREFLTWPDYQETDGS